ncbi:hypothetical protein FGG08_005259 [Glutinoglossum americanum]|uniref:Nucleolar complex-associated protein 3 n=1 Tax=Glutinoglossum americanum TaxID=1670608 RepID=A0A9P8HYU3_9PEZI|nr:hypothetical protein FGG08_005259 [Glutinoglossum americanum]
MAQIPATKRRRLSPPLASGDKDTSPSTLEADPNDDYLARASRWDLEQDYEQHPRKLRKQEKEYTRLPIKTSEGRIEQLVVPVVENAEEAESFSGFSEDEDEVEDERSEEEVGAKIPPRQQVIEAKEELARIAGLINEDPEENAPLFRVLAQLALSRNITVKKLALATQLAVYKDVIPGYRIRPLSENDTTTKVSKEVRRLRSFEQSLVAGYQNYIRELSRLANAGRGDSVGKETASLASVAISCACALLVAVPHFNFRGEILKILVDKLSGRRVDDDFVKCRETLETLFRNDEDGTPSLDAVALLTKMMKTKHYRIDESVLNTFLHLRLLSEFSSKGSQNSIDRLDDLSNNIHGKKKLKEKKQFRTKAQRKVEKARKAVEKEFKEADATVSHEERDRMQAETLKLVFVTYFRILKARTPRLMGAVLEGLAKYAHLINQDFFGDLLEALKDLIGHAESTDPTESEDLDGHADEAGDTAQRNAVRESLLCIITAFALLHGQDTSNTGLNLDLNFFTTHLYRTLHTLSLDPSLELSPKSLHPPDPTQSPLPPKHKVNIATTTILLLRSLTYILLPSLNTRAVPPIRIAAFTKQLMTTSLQLPEKSSVAMLALMTKAAKVHGRKMAGLWNSEERRGDGVFDPLRGEVEGCNPYASTVWEGEILRRHYCPGVREGVKVLEGVIRGVN